MPLSVFPELTPRARWLRIILLSATLLGLAACPRLWLNTRDYPLLPVASWYPIVPGPWDKVVFGLVMLSLLAAFRFYRSSVMFFLGAALFLYGGDQTRGQPWLYLYWLMLLATLAPERTALAACRFILSAVYFWGGLQKFNPKFYATIPAFFSQPLADLGLPDFLVSSFRGAVVAAPIVEVFIGLALWIPRARGLAIALVVMLHGSTLLVLGPLGHKYNFVVWPWNLAMIGLVIALFPADGIVRVWRDLRASRGAVAGVMLVCLLPGLSYRGWWDSSFSFALYSQSQAMADVFLTERVRDELPPPLRDCVQPLRQAYDPNLQGPFLFDHQAWAFHAVGVPPLMEVRGYRVMFRSLLGRTTHPEDLRMIVGPRRGPMELHTREAVRVLDLESK